MSRYDLTDFEWRVIEPLLPNRPRGVPRVDDRCLLTASSGGCNPVRPRDLPEHWGTRTTCYSPARWRKGGVWDRMMDATIAARHGDIQMIDSTSVRAHQQAATPKRGADHCLGRSRGGSGSGRTRRRDRRTTGRSSIRCSTIGPHTIVLADKAYDDDRIRELIQCQSATPNIPPNSNGRWKPCFSKRLYRERNLVERFFSKLKPYRRVATRCDKLAVNFLAMHQLPSTRLRAHRSKT
jgi:transposase